MNDKIKKSVKPILIIWFISVLCYLPLIARGLTNSVDGCWHSGYFQAGNWELSIGRWAWLFLDKARGGYAAEPFNSLLTLLLISIAAYIAITMFISGKLKSYIYAMLILCSVSVCCFLSFRYMSPTFGMSVLLSTIAALLITRETDSKRKEIILFLACVALIVLTLGLYQANLGCFGAIVVVYMMQLIINSKSKQCLRVLVKSLIAGMAGCVLYKIAWEICLRFRHVSAASYRGADSISVGKILTGLPGSIRDIYEAWLTCPIYNGNYIFRPIRALIVLMMFVLVLFVGIRALRKDVKSLIIFLLLFLVLPIGANISIVLSAGVTLVDAQMTGPITMSVPILLCMIESVGFKYDKLLGIMGALLLYGNVYAVGTDIDAMAQGSTSSCVIMNSIVNTLNNDGILSDDYRYAFYGNISANELFKVNELYTEANWYARFGDMLGGFDMSCNTYWGLLDDIGVDVEMVGVEDFKEIYYSGVLEEMPAYPAQGSILEKDGCVIIKVSDDCVYE
ncbi:MAG: glucosyltransferase domain-containing protein [Lachnospiraceae bacterium]|nr:glucosyltransferase domain-containing protein [Lachnospiraceae bacterium]